MSRGYAIEEKSGTYVIIFILALFFIEVIHNDRLRLVLRDFPSQQKKKQINFYATIVYYRYFFSKKIQNDLEFLV